MATNGESYPWTRQPGESNVAYEAFRSYMDKRRMQSVCDELGKHMSQISRWSVEWQWVERCRAYDVFLEEQATDGLVHELLQARSKDLELVDRLRWHLANRLEEFITKNLDPTVRWTQALKAMTDVQRNAFAMREDAKTSEQLDRVEAMIRKLEDERAQDPA